MSRYANCISYCVYCHQRTIGLISFGVKPFFFALQHSFIPFLLDMKFITYRFFSFLPLTMILCYIYSKKKNPLPILIAHVLIDVFTVVWILITSINPDFFNQLVK